MLLELDSPETLNEFPKQPFAASLKINVTRAALLKSLSHIQTIVERKTTVPILAQVKIEAIAPGELKLSATDMEISVIERINAEILTEGSLTVPAHTFYEIVRKLPDDSTIELSVDAQDPGKLLLRAAASKFVLPCLSASDFPAIEHTDMPYHFSLTAAEYKMMIDKTRFAISTEETRYNLNGIYFHVIEKEGVSFLRAVATDGHRLAKVEVPLPEEAQGIPGIILPKKTVSELNKMLAETEEDIKISLSSSKICFQFRNVILLSKLIDGTFPDYEKVIPENNTKILEADRLKLMKAVDRVSTIASEKTRSIRLEISSGKLHLSVSTDNNGQADEDLEAIYSADSLEIGFNSRYLLEMMSVMEGDTIQFIFADNTAPSLVRDPADLSTLFVIMPMRV